MATACYPLIASSLIAGGLNFSADTIKLALTTSSYTPADTHQYYSDLTNEVAGTGYTAGGNTVGSKTETLTEANSWAATWAATTDYSTGVAGSGTSGYIVRPTSGNGFLYRAAVGGTSGGAEPTWPTVVGETVTDGGVTWTCAGKAVLMLDFADSVWSASTITARTAVLYKDTGTGTTSPLIAYDTLPADVSTTSGDWTYVVASQGMVPLFIL